MKRKLDKLETKLTKKGIKSRKKRIKEMTLELDYIKGFKEFNEKHADYLEMKRIKEAIANERSIEQLIKLITERLKIENSAIITEKLHLKQFLQVTFFHLQFRFSSPIQK